jgi:hypothetical protein
MRYLLIAYPREYRQERGDEILSTLRDRGHARPTVRIAANLLRHGLRARLSAVLAITIAAYPRMIWSWSWRERRGQDREQGATG